MADERKTIPVADLVGAPWNPKVPINGSYRRGLQSSLGHFGVRDDLKVWPDPAHPGQYDVLDGNQRLDVLRESGLAAIECRVLADLDPDDAKLFTASFDRNAAQFDESKLAALADDLRAKGADLVARLLRPDLAMVKPPARGDTPALAEAKQELLGSVPIMFSLTPDGYAAAKSYLLRSKNRLKQEERLLEVLAGLSERQIDDLVVDLAIQIASDG